MTTDNITLIVVLVITGAVGYFIVGKAVDFFKHGSAWEEKVPPGVKDLSNPKDDGDKRDTRVS